MFQNPKRNLWDKVRKRGAIYIPNYDFSNSIPVKNSVCLGEQHVLKNECMVENEDLGLLLS